MVTKKKFAILLFSRSMKEKTFFGEFCSNISVRFSKMDMFNMSKIKNQKPFLKKKPPNWDRFFSSFF